MQSKKISNEEFVKNKQVRTLWNEAEEEWCFSAVDVVLVLTDSMV